MVCLSSVKPSCTNPNSVWNVDKPVMYDIIMILSITPNRTLPRSHLPWSIVMMSVPQLRQTVIVVLGMMPNWSGFENSVIELGAAILYAAVAE
jgi:hypothetical protein